ncbi:alpha/beta hydrolase family protein [Biformimicrobium ophioploci]|uniref:Alpha/beta hydrolase n=1 Tax=Biformimicrobium ophioploci TaxID=3036711 RepID=A0ABQ6LZX8_9GAMM|nr:alpha/beta hydrolase [Microbulbifer sp. NKW57]GMG87644.1 alpha/beta hydrolase [Microbulbifer sp. NKW57]
MSASRLLPVIGLLAAIGSANIQAAEVSYPPVPANPAYSDVTALPFRAHDQKIYYGEHQDQYGLLWLPSAPGAIKRPTIVMVHGGCWLNAYDISHTRALATALAQEGYPVWNLEYRRADKSRSAWPTSLEDLQRGIKALGALKTDELIRDEVIIVGHSAGGHLALLLAASWRQLFPKNAPDVSVVGLAAITDITRYAGGNNSCQTATPLFMGATPKENPQAYAAANPANLDIPIPVTLLQGSADPIVPMAQLEALQARNVAREIAPEAGHFDWIHPGTPAFQLMLRALGKDDDTRQAPEVSSTD